MREAAELAWQRPSGLGVGGGHVRQACGPGHVPRRAFFSTGHLPHEEQGRSAKDDTGYLLTLKRVGGPMGSHPNLRRSR